LTFTAETPDNGKLTYQWYSNTTASNEGGTPIDGAKSTAPAQATISGSYTPVNLNTATILYFYVVVTNTIPAVADGGKTERTAKSSVAAIIVKNEVRAKAPKISTQPASATYAKDADPVDLKVVASSQDGGSLTYQWYRTKADSNAEGEPIEGADKAFYKPDTGTRKDVTYYFCEVTNTLPPQEESVLVAAQSAKARSDQAYIGISITVINLDGLKAENKVYNGTMEAVVTGIPRMKVGAAQQNLPFAGTDVKLEGFTPDNPNAAGNTPSTPTQGKAAGLFASPNAGTDIRVEIQGMYLSGDMKDEYLLVVPVLKANIDKAAGCDVEILNVTYQNAEIRGKNVTLAQGSRLVDITNSTDPNVTTAQKNLNKLQLEQQLAIEYQAGKFAAPGTPNPGAASNLVGTPVTTLKIAGLTTTQAGYWFFARSKETQNFKAGKWTTNPDSVTSIRTKPGAPVNKPGVLKDNDGNSIGATDTSITVGAVTIKTLPTNGTLNDWLGFDTGQSVQYAIHTNGTLGNNLNSNDYKNLVWQASTTFKNFSTYTNLTTGAMNTQPLNTVTNYYVYARAAEDADYEAGVPTVSDVIQTGSPKIYFITDSSNNLPPKPWTKNTPFPVTAIDNITKADYDIEGWYINAAKTIPYNFAVNVTNSITIYARWTLRSEKLAMRARPYVPMAQVPSGWFKMGTNTEPNRNNNEINPHWVALSGFWMGMYEITQEEWMRVMKDPNNPNDTGPFSFKSGADTGEVQNRRPAENISWYEALVFCNKLSSAEGLTPAYRMNVPANIVNGVNNGGSGTESNQPINWGPIPTSNNNYWNAVTIDPQANGYRLPSEAQWEYACRAGTTTGYNFGRDSWNNNTTDNAFGWNSWNSNNKTHEVGKKTANNWGFFDMHGNVNEWTFDFSRDQILQYQEDAYTNTTYYILTPGYGEVYRTQSPTNDERHLNPKGLPNIGRDNGNANFTYTRHIVRGGNYLNTPGNNPSVLRSAARSAEQDSRWNYCYAREGQFKANWLGLRIVRPY